MRQQRAGDERPAARAVKERFWSAVRQRRQHGRLTCAIGAVIAQVIRVPNQRNGGTTATASIHLRSSSMVATDGTRLASTGPANDRSWEIRKSLVGRLAPSSPPGSDVGLAGFVFFVPQPWQSATFGHPS